ncbi:MAG: beta-glucosidase [bacterium]|nr:beta-glucosidase [bacterium]
MPGGFVWGVATAAYQIEGSHNVDGRGESIWDRFSHTAGNTYQGQTGDVACDSYVRWPDDIALMRKLNVGGYRFSIAWPRVFPNGSGDLNHKGLDYYDKLVDGLLEVGITPFPTLYHWDLPQALEDTGGWINRDTAYRFADYAAVVADRLGDRVHDWWTINEPWCVAELGYRSGTHAPGRQEPREWFAAAHDVLLAHGLGMEAVRAAAPASKVGIVINVDAVMPRSVHAADQAAAAMFELQRNHWYLDPVLKGEYPQAAVDEYGWGQAEVEPGDMETIAAPMDHFGLNYYSRSVIRDESIDDRERPQPLIETDLPRTTMGWEVYPDGLSDLLIKYDREFDLPPIYVAENGVAFADELVGGAVHDEDRCAYLESHFAAAATAVEGGVDLRGFFVWSLLDNFEWQHGYTQRFGLAWTDYETQHRIIKDSGHWFSSFVGGKRPM